MIPFLGNYRERLVDALQKLPEQSIKQLLNASLAVWQRNAQLFICGNGGSAANALHIANDLFYGIAKDEGKGIRVQALTANQSVLTCLANDLAYSDIFSKQLDVLAGPGDMLIVLSGSGNSPNILNALRKAKEMQVTSAAILGYTGGDAVNLADIPIHIPVHDMQIAEDIQLIIGHFMMQWLCANRPKQSR